jgi:hypothetical protein
MFGISFTKDDLKRAVWTFLQAFVVVFAAGLSDLLDAFKADGLDAGTSAAVALVVAAIAAGLSALKNLVLADTSALK